MSEQSVKLRRSGKILVAMLNNKKVVELAAAASQCSAEEIIQALLVAIDAESNEAVRDSFDEDESLFEPISSIAKNEKAEDINMAEFTQAVLHGAQEAAQLAAVSRR